MDLEGQRFTEGAIAEDKLVPDEVDLGRHPSMWWTMNCKYNAAYDVQRMNTKSALGDASVAAAEPGDKHERFLFTRDNPDLVAYMLSLRTELLMRIVMPSIVPHSRENPFMAMARFEVGANGNPHMHGFSLGDRGPKMTRVEADVSSEGDLPPQTVSEDVRVFLSRLEKADDWKYGVEMSSEELRQLVRHHLTDVEHAGSDDGEESDSGVSSADDQSESAAADDECVDFLVGRVRAVVTALIEQGLIQEVAGGGSAEACDVKYTRVPPVPVAPEEWKRRGRRKVPLLPVGGTSKMQDLGIMKPEAKRNNRRGF